MVTQASTLMLIYKSALIPVRMVCTDQLFFLFFINEYVSEQKKNKEPTRGTDYICLYLFSSEHNFIHRSSSFHTFQKDHDF